MSFNLESLPQHIRKYIVDQNYAEYTFQDQAVWRYCLRQLKHFLSKNAFEGYLEGLELVGISEEEIPKISEISKRLQSVGWAAVPVSGFIPVSIFLELQANKILPIACDMRTVDHLRYTPAPDIVHEAAGHSPILFNKEFREYLCKYATVASRAILNKDDHDLYEAIRYLSDIKEHPNSTEEEILKAESNLKLAYEKIKSPSEASLLSRFAWWSNEYGLVGNLDSPKIFGAGLLSSVYESHAALDAKTKKIPMSLGMVDASYNITEPQPQLFVTPSFDHLSKLYDELVQNFSYRTGGVKGLALAHQSQCVNTVVLDTGLQISGVLQHYRTTDFLKFSGPCQLAYQDKELENQGKEHHAHGFSTALGKAEVHLQNSQIIEIQKCTDWLSLSSRESQEIEVFFKSGIHLKGHFSDCTIKDQKVLIVHFSSAEMYQLKECLFDKSWGSFDLAIGERVVSVYAGPADKIKYGDIEPYPPQVVPPKVRSLEFQNLDLLYKKVREIRAHFSAEKMNDLTQILEDLKAHHSKDWLLPLEIYEISCSHFGADHKLAKQCKEILAKFDYTDSRISEGIHLAH